MNFNGNFHNVARSEVVNLFPQDVFCQNGIPVCPLTATLPNNEARGRCPIPVPNFSRASPQLINSLQSQAAARGVSIDQLLAQEPVLSKNLLTSQTLPEGFGQQEVPLGGPCPKCSMNSKAQLQPCSNNLITPCFNSPTSVSCNVNGPQPTELSPAAKPFFPQTLSPPPVFPQQNTFFPSSCGTTQPLGQQCNNQLSLSGLSTNSIIGTEVTTVLTNPISSTPVSNCPQQLFLNPMATLTNPCSMNYLHETNSSPTSFPCFSSLTQPLPSCLPQLTEDPTITNFQVTSTVITDVDPPSIIIQESESTVISPTESIETTIVSNTINSENIDVQQAIVTTESSPQLPINLVIDIPPVTVASPFTAFSLPSAPQAIPLNVPSFGAYSQPIVLQTSKSKLKNWLPIILLALLNNNEYGGGCGC